MALLKVIVFLGSVREGRFGERVAKLICEALKKHDIEPVLYDPQEMQLPLLKLPLHFMPDPTKAPQWMQDVNEEIINADGFIVVSAEYNCTIPPPLTNMMDHFSPNSYRYRPCGICTYSVGALGGCRAAVALRPFLAELGLANIPTVCGIPNVMAAVDENGVALNDDVTQRSEKLVTELKWYASAIKSHKEKEGTPL